MAIVNSSTAWLGAAFLVGALSRRAGGGAVSGAALLTAFNLVYYASGATTSAPALRWFELGVAGGAVFGLLGFAARTGRPLLRAAAALTLAGVCVFEAAGLRTHVLGPGVP